ncbi:MAG TPA: hypothetical protein DCE44_05310, partial [Verrucomicrobiales bacterium]|nr:hypothetical protein [Verrucomicrobiales bacterium]
MNHHSRSLRALFVAIFASSFVWAADSPTPLTVRTAIEVEFGTETGKVYQLQGSSNLVDWTSIGDPVFGVGRTVTRVFSTRTGGNVSFQTYRLETSAGPTNGFAPWSLAGVVLGLDDQPGNDLMRFVSETEGVDDGDEPDPFTYLFSRIDLNTVTADIQYRKGRHDRLTLTFTAVGIGTWVREEFRNDKLKDRDIGVFSIQGSTDGGTNHPPVEPPGVPTAIPQVLTGLAYVFQDDSSPDRLEFTSAVNGTEIGDDVADDEPNTFTYTYSLTSPNTAQLVVIFKPGKFDEYDLTFVSGAQGEFVRREFKNGLLKDTDRGSFSAQGTAPGDPDADDNPPDNSGSKPDGTLKGLTYTMRTGETPDHLVFSTESSGIESGDDVDDNEPNTFTYTYTSTGDTTAGLV